MKKLGLIVIAVAVAAAAVWYFAIYQPAIEKEMAAASAGAAIKERKDNRKALRAEMIAIKKIIDEKGNAADVVARADKMVALGMQFEKHFPAGSGVGDTKALPVIWTDWAGFQAANKAMETAAGKLAAAGKSGDLTQVAAAFGETGKTCGACHEKYQAK